ncbi:hypothetical protein [Gaetbulibacter sp. PBL-D1]|uniref:hypothetical protein n=1 Tax=Gaetbulibacter sp. PBL-D1 TaxID=3422594 RepID=UPI003D2EE849
MKKILKISLVLLTFIGFVSCDSTDDDTSYLNDRTPVAYFVPGNSGTLLVEEGVTRNAQITVGVSESRPYDRSFTVSIDPTSSAIEGEDFLLPNTTFQIPANSLVGSFNVTSGDYEASSLSGKTVKINLVEVEDTSVIGPRITYSLVVIRYCPIPETYMVGEYAISDVAATVGPGNGTENFSSSTVTISTSATDPTARVFSASVLPAFNSEIETVTLYLSCGSFSMSDVLPGLSCQPGGANPAYIFSTDPDNISTYDLDDDQSFVISYIEDPDSSCGGPFESSFSLTKL